MSDYEKRSGLIRLVKPDLGETLEEQCLRLWIENGEPEEKYSKHILFDEYYNKYFRIDNQVWEFLENTKEDPYDSYCKLTKNTDDTYSFSTFFYNGGSSESEMIAQALQNIEQ